MNKIKDSFIKFVNNYDHSDEMIMLKDIHTHEVAKLMSLLVNKLNLNERDKYLAMVIAYFHDAGRFSQVVETQSMSDKFYNHAEKSCELIKEKKIFEDLGLNEEEKQVAHIAIFNHNKYEIAKDLDERSAFFSKLIRDVDKIDIFRVSFETRRTKFFGELNKELEKEFFLEKGIKHKDVKEPSDRVAQRLAFLYDMNFKESFEILKDTKYFEKYIASLKIASDQEDKFKELKIKINDYFKRRLEC